MQTKLLLLLVCVATMVVIITSCQSEGEQLFNRYYSTGAILYKTHCENCHGANGEGLGALIPPLHDSVYFRQNITKLACFVKAGLSDTITVAGNKYSGKMPAQDNLSAIEVAEILTYVTNSWGNKIGIIDADKVSKEWVACGK